MQSETSIFKMPVLTATEKKNIAVESLNPDDAVMASVVGSWELVMQFLGTPQKARLTTMPNHHFLDIYFP